MMTLGPIGFLEPWALAGLAALPVIWWLLRFTPPRPQLVVFPPTRLLKELEDTRETPQHSPWWLTALRMLLAALIILALARPVLHPDRERLPGDGTLLLVVDNGWAAASHWEERQKLLSSLIERAERADRSVILVGTAETGNTTLTPVGPEKAREAAAGLQPRPYQPRRGEIAQTLRRSLAGRGDLTVAWLTDGMAYDGTAPFAAALQDVAGSSGSITVYRPAPEAAALGLHVGLGDRGQLIARLARAEGTSRRGEVLAYSAKNERLGEAAFELAQGSKRAEAKFSLPLEIRNQVTRVEIGGERSAGSVHLLDARSRWRRVGIISGESGELAQPLLSPLYYVERALKPYAEVNSSGDRNVTSAVQDLLARNLSVMMLANIGKIVGGTLEELTTWVRRGGTLVRFAGPRLEQGGDQLLPSRLRQGGRTLGGSLSWSTPQSLAPFEDSSPFFGLAPPAEVTVRRQVLTDPAARGNAQVWARLKDGTPLVSAAPLGDGTLVLFHVTANSDWSNLPISGLFVGMLRRIVDRSTVAAGASGSTGKADTAKTDGAVEGGVLAPLQTLDGLGRLGPPAPTVAPVKKAEFEKMVPGPRHPPGYYGPSGAARALNAVGPKTVFKALSTLPDGARAASYGVQKAVTLKRWLLAGAFAVFLADILAVLFLMARPRGRRSARTAAASAVFFIFGALLIAAPSQAQEATKTTDQFALQAALKTRLAYVVSGDSQIDNVSLQGLTGLGKVLRARTAIEPGQPMGVDIDRDEIAFFPLLYWPVRPDAKTLADETLAKIDAYMKQGGMIVFDTRDYQTSLPSGGGQTQGPGATALSRLLGKLDIPPLEPVPEAHVLTKSFYLLRNFPGRWDGGTMWVEAEPRSEAKRSDRARRSDGVSSLLITSNDLAAAWALNDSNRPLFPVVPGGEVQREMAFRVGVNIVMYALTGNYKADQVHVPALLERLGQ
ncbi:MAG: DUF4159 domain-containing protein [Methyloligellaceae bacterium]